MRHGKKDNHLGRTASHRKAMLSNMANSLILNKRIVTTLAKAKELRKYVEPILTKSKDDTTHNRRTAFSYLKNKEAIKILFGEISEKIASRNGGYTRIIKLGTRSGDAAETALIELVDYNELLLTVKSQAPAKAKRTRRAGSKKTEGTPVAEAVVVADEAIEETPAAEIVADEVEKTEEIIAEPTAEVVETETADEIPTTESETPAEPESSVDEAPEASADEEEPKKEE
jgi:large subunit ribosomal protein L17